MGMPAERVLHVNPLSPGYDAPDPTNYASKPTVAARAIKTVKAAMELAKEARGTLPEAWRQNVHAYFNIRMRKNFKGRANVVDPEPFRVIETISSRVEKAMLPAKPWLRGVPGPGEIQSDRKQAEINEALIQQQLEVGSNGKIFLKDAIKSFILLGTAVSKVQWVNESVMRRMRDPVTGRLTRPDDSYVYRGGKWTPVDLEDLFVADPLGGCTPDDQDFVIERKVVRIQKLRSMQKLGQLENTAGLKPTTILSRHYEEEGAKQERAAMIGSTYEVMDPAKSPVGKTEIYMYEGPFDLYEDGNEIECWIWISPGDDIALRVIENPYFHGQKSYVSAPCIRVPGNFYGLSPLQPILDLWCELCDMHNMGLDSAVLSLNPAIKVGAGAGIDYKRWMLSPGAFLPANDISQVEAFVIPPMVDVSHSAMGPLRQMMRETTSATDLLQAQSTGGIDKATIYQGALTEANVRIAMIGSNFADMLEAGGRKHWGLIMQYMDEETLVRIMGKDGYEWIPVRPEDVKYPMDFKAVGVQNIGAEMARNYGIERFVSVFTPLAPVVPIDWIQVAKTYWNVLGMEDADSIIAPQGPQPMDPRQENRMLKQRQPVDVNPKEDFAMHYRAHVAELQEYLRQPNPDPVVLMMWKKHIEETRQMAERVRQAKEAMVQLQTQQALAGVEQGGGNGNGSSVPAIGNQAAYGPMIGGAKEIGERLGGRLG